MPDAPVLQRFLFSDTIIRDSLTGKWSAIGIYDHFYLPRLPVVVDAMWFYALVSDVPPRVRFEAIISAPNGGPVVSYRENHFDIDPRQRHSWEVGGRFLGVTIGAFGRYSTTLRINGEQIGETPLHVVPESQRAGQSGAEA